MEVPIAFFKTELQNIKKISKFKHYLEIPESELRIIGTTKRFNVHIHDDEKYSVICPNNRSCPACVMPYAGFIFPFEKSRLVACPTFSHYYNKYVILITETLTLYQISKLNYDKTFIPYAYQQGAESFLEYIIDNPEDLVARLAYADWLDEHDQHDKAKILRKFKINPSEYDPIDGQNIKITYKTTTNGYNPFDWNPITIETIKFGLGRQGLMTDVETLINMPDLQKDIDEITQPTKPQYVRMEIRDILHNNTRN